MTTRDSVLTVLIIPVVEGSLSDQGADGSHQNAVTNVLLRRTGQLFSLHCEASVGGRRIKRVLQRLRDHCHAGGNDFACTFSQPTLTRTLDKDTIYVAAVPHVRVLQAPSLVTSVSQARLFTSVRSLVMWECGWWNCRRGYDTSGRLEDSYHA